MGTDREKWLSALPQIPRSTKSKEEFKYHAAVIEAVKERANRSLNIRSSSRENILKPELIFRGGKLELRSFSTAKTSPYVVNSSKEGSATLPAAVLLIDYSSNNSSLARRTSLSSPDFVPSLEPSAARRALVITRICIGQSQSPTMG